MKAVRQAAILEIIRREKIETQEELAKALEERGMQVTQATISRDIRELRLSKVQNVDGSSYYIGRETGGSSLEERFQRMLSESLLSVTSSGTMVVIRTLSGSANVAGEALDSLEWPEVLGSLAGDNTIFLVIRSQEETGSVVERIRGMMK